MRVRGTTEPSFDWNDFFVRRWGCEPARLASPALATLRGRAFRIAIEISKPFRRGMRFFALPDVRFFAGVEEIRAPGLLLPGMRDRDLSDYLRRLATSLPSELASVEIEQPLMADAAAWNEVRNFLAGLCDRIGCPLSPIVASLVLGRFDRRREYTRESVLLVPLQGEIRVRFEDAAMPAELRRGTSLVCGAGQMLYWPAGCRVRERCTEGALALRLVIPEDAAAPLGEARKLFTTMWQQDIHPRNKTPYLPFPPRKGADGAVALPRVLARMHRALAHVHATTETEQVLRVQWASRVSACALEPVPDFVACKALRLADRVRMDASARIVVMPMAKGVVIWAVNGYAFAMEDTPASDSLLRRLRDGGVRSVAELCDFDATGDAGPALALLNRLRGARALHVVAGPVPKARSRASSRVAGAPMATRG